MDDANFKVKWYDLAFDIDYIQGFYYDLSNEFIKENLFRMYW